MPELHHTRDRAGALQYTRLSRISPDKRNSTRHQLKQQQPQLVDIAPGPYLSILN